MLAPEIPLKLSAAGIRLTGYMVEKQLRVAQVCCEAMLKNGMWARTLTAKAAEPAVPVKPKAPAKPTAATAAAKPRRATRAPVAPVAPAIKAVKKSAPAPVVAKPAPVAEVKSAPQPAPVAAAKPAPVAEVKSAPQPVATPVSLAQPTARVIPVETGAPKRQPSPPPAMPVNTPKAKGE